MEGQLCQRNVGQLAVLVRVQRPAAPGCSQTASSAVQQEAHVRREPRHRRRRRGLPLQRKQGEPPGHEHPGGRPQDGQLSPDGRDRGLRVTLFTSYLCDFRFKLLVF
uniref:(northern house mosquito) hypothetical protein n=1 Tax=Culex pipiens TaxID=7175 RepID=A0A8D8A1A8_CULPI